MYKDETPDNNEMKKAIDRAYKGADKYLDDWKRHIHLPNDAEYWHKKYIEEREAAWNLRKQCWALRDELLSLREAIRNVLDGRGNEA